MIKSSWLMSKQRSTVKVCAKCATEFPLEGSVVHLLVTVVPSIWQQSSSSVVHPEGSSTRYLQYTDCTADVYQVIQKTAASSKSKTGPKNS